VDIVMRALGAATAEHVCKCGMPVGKCGCPECDRLEQERRQEHAAERIATLKRHCDDDAPAVPFGVLAQCVLAPTAGTTPPVPCGARTSPPMADDDLTTHENEPPTPPPRIAA
jgi:hypothetical protein